MPGLHFHIFSTPWDGLQCHCVCQSVNEVCYFQPHWYLPSQISDGSIICPPEIVTCTPPPPLFLLRPPTPLVCRARGGWMLLLLTDDACVLEKGCTEYSRHTYCILCSPVRIVWLLPLVYYCRLVFVALWLHPIVAVWGQPFFFFKALSNFFK